MTKRPYITDIHSTTSQAHGANIDPLVTYPNVGDLRSPAAGRGYDANAFRDDLQNNSIRPLIKHRLFTSLDHAHNARVSA